jgi:putative endonuclease
MNPIFSSNDRIQKSPASLIGQRGEGLAVKFLQKSGMQIVVANFRIPIGRNRKGVAVNAEIDLIALDEATLCFIEVKTRSAEDGFAPETAVNLRKQRQIIRAAKKYRKIFRLNMIDFRYDVISIVLKDKQPAKIEHLKSFWNEEKFRKSNWSEDDYSMI